MALEIISTVSEINVDFLIDKSLKNCKVFQKKVTKGKECEGITYYC
jgi:hypothetical protein